MTDIETLVSQVFPYVKGVVSAYGQAVLSQSEDAAASETLRLGQRLLATVLRRGKPKPKVESAVRELAGAPEDPVAAQKLHEQLGQALREDPDLVRELAAMVNVRVSRSTVSGHHNVNVGDHHQGPIHMGDNTSNTHHNIHHTVHNNVHERRISGFSIAALVAGLLGFLILPIPVAIVFGLLALTRVLRSPAPDPGTSQAGGGTTGFGGPPTASGPPVSMTGPAGTTGAAPGTAANSTPRPAEPTGPAESAAGPATTAPDGSVGQPGPSATGTPPGGDAAAPIAPDGFAGQPGHSAGMYPPPASGPAAASTPFTPPVAGASAPFAPAVGTGFAAAKAISVVFSLVGLLAALLWGIGWTAVAAVVVQAESGSYASEGTDPFAPDTDPSVSTGEGRVPSPADLCEPSPGYATVCTLATGDCFIEPPTTEFYEVELTSCDEPHNAQVIGSYSPSEGDWPGWAAFEADINATCSPMSDRTLNPARTPDTYFVGYLAPNQDAWDYGIQEAFCYVAADGESWTTSLTS